MPSSLPHGRHDTAERRRATRKQRERGCTLYIPAEALERAGWPLDAPPPFYRVWPRPGKKSLAISFYATK